MTLLRATRRGSRALLAIIASVALLSSVAVGMDAGVAAAVTGAPTGLTPNDGTPHKNPILRWTPVDGASTYQVQVSPNPAFTNNLTIDKTGILIAEYALPTTLPHASYFWHVRVAPLVGTPGPWSDNAQLLRDWVAAPTGAAFDAAHGLFTWNALEDASAYEIEFSKTPDFPQPNVQQTKAAATDVLIVAAASTGPVVTPSAAGPLSIDGVLPVTGEYVLLKNQQPSSGDGIYTVVQAGSPTSPYVLSLYLAPIEGSVVKVTAGGVNGTKVWIYHNGTYEAYVGSNSCIVNHPAYAFTDHPAAKPDVTDGVCLNWRVFLNAGDSYYWRVRGRDGTNTAPVGEDTDPGLGCAGATYEDGAFPPSTSAPECSHWSYPSQVFTMPGVPTPPPPSGRSAHGKVPPSASGQLAKPADVVASVQPQSNDACGVTGSRFTCDDTPEVTWAAVPGATSYQTYVAYDAALTNVQYIYDGPSASVAPVGSWLDTSTTTPYTIAIQACNAAGCSDQFTFITIAKHSDPVRLLQPVTTTQAVDASHPRMVWTDFLPSGGHNRQEARDYRLQVATEASFTTPLEDVTIDREGDVAGQAEYTSPDKVYPDGTLYWRVAPIDGSKNLLTWTTAASFVKDTSGATATITTPNGVSILGPVTVAFNQPVVGVSSASLGLVLSGTSTAVPATVSVPSVLAAVITPRVALIPGGVYALAVEPSIKDATGNSAIASATTVRTATGVTPGSAALVERWDPDSSTNAYAGAYEKSATLNDVASLSFTGTSVSLSGPRSTSGGYAHVYVDGFYKATVSFYAPATVWQSTVWTSSALSDAAHTVRVYVTGTRETASRGNFVYIDQWTVGTATYQEASGDATHHAYDAWSRQVATDASGRVADMEQLDGHFLNGGIPTATAVVAGATVTVKVCRSPRAGYAYVYVDGARRSTMNLYLSYTSCGYIAYSGPLTPGVHSVGIGVTGIVPAGSKGSAVGLDTISVT